MQDLIKQEQFELEVLDKLNSKRFLDDLLFGGGTMLRLCFNLNRYSVDLDFWIAKNINRNKLFNNLKVYLEKSYIIKDCANKFYTLLYEIKSKQYPRSLKIEIRKEIKKVKSEQAIAYSRYSNIQVILKVISLEDMMSSKVRAFLDRKEIRDVFDIEFLLKKGINLSESKEVMEKILKEINNLKSRDYAEKLGSILESNQRQYYKTENFKILKLVIKEKLGTMNLLFSTL